METRKSNVIRISSRDSNTAADLTGGGASPPVSSARSNKGHRPALAHGLGSGTPCLDGGRRDVRIDSAF